MSFQVDQEVMVETDTTVNNTGEDIVGQTGENTVPLLNNNKGFIALLILKLTVLVRIFSYPGKKFRFAARICNISGVLGRIYFLIF